MSQSDFTTPFYPNNDQLHFIEITLQQTAYLLELSIVHGVKSFYRNLK